MTVRVELTKVLGKITKTNLGKELQEIYRTLNSSVEPNPTSPANRTHFGYVARQHGRQFFGFIQTDALRAKSLALPIPFKIPEITQAERDCLWKGHQLLTEIDQAVVKGVVAQLPGWGDALSPYSGFDYERTSFDTSEVMGSVDFDPLSAAFANSEPALALIGTPDQLKRKLKPIDIGESADRLNEVIDKVAPHSSPPELQEATLKIPRETEPHYLNRALIATASLRRMIGYINQMVFEAIVNGRPKLVNEDNLIDIQKVNHHFLGAGYTVYIQPTENEVLINPGSLVLFILNDGHREINNFCEVTGLTQNFHMDTGYTTSLKLRMLNDDLNPYFRYPFN